MIPLPIPIIRDVVSIGDVLLAFGIFWAIVYSMIRVRHALEGRIGDRRDGRSCGPPPPRPGRPAQPYAEAGTIPAEVSEAGAEVAGMRRQSPYLRLFANRNFSLLWTGQLISLIGDRIHVIALGALVAGRGTALEVGIVFAMTAVPSVFFGPLAGVFVDRWDRRRTMIACDLVRAALVLAVPLAFEIHIGLVYAIAFALATVTLLFRPAKTAVIPAVVGDRDLVAANSALSVPETAADLIGFPIAGLIVTALSSVLGAAFVLDAGTYVVSAVLLWAMILPRHVSDFTERISIGAVWREMAEGFGFLWRQPVLLSNTLLSTVAQVAVGAEIVVSLIYARDVVDRGALSFEQMYSLLLMAIAVGSVLAGIAVGAIGDRLPKGPMVIAGFIGMGLALCGGRPRDRSHRRHRRLPPLGRVQHGLHHSEHHALPGAHAAATHGPGRIEPAGARVRFARSVDGALRVARRGHRSGGGARRQRRDLRGGRRRRHPHPIDAQRPLIRGRSATLRAPWD